ncbi:phage major capsid protein [Gemmata sp.]|uniref:phage major capsid protein n=1 Tax=Gemmata sp. TaxID=1914242 RepID=UPI003F7193B2
MNLTNALRAHLEAKGWVPQRATECQCKDVTVARLLSDELSHDELNEFLKNRQPSTKTSVKLPAKGHEGNVMNPLFSNVRVKNATEAYSSTKSVAKHAKTNRPVTWLGKQVETHSERELAKLGAWMKWTALRSGAAVVLTEHEKGLCADIIEKDRFAGEVNGQWSADVHTDTVKALINDTTSGGSYINPIWFDEMIVQFPLLHSEILPHVTVVDVPRGVNVQGGSIGNPTVVWGTAEGTAQTEFDTTALAAQLNTTIKPVLVWLTCGRDWLSDVPVNAGQYLVENIGERMLAELDRVIVSGDGTNEPAGISGTAGVTAVSSDNSTSGPPTVGDYESLMFAVGKQYRNDALNPGFIGNDVSYRRARGIPVGPADERRVFGMDESSYSILEHPYHVANGLPNGTTIFGALKKYRLYRRVGSQVTWVSGTDATLMAKNLDALFVRARFGGRVTDASAFAITTDGQS